MKGLGIIAAILIIIAIVFVGNAEEISVKWEEKSRAELQDQALEEALYKNIKYVYTVGKYERTLELVEKYLEAYDIYDEYDKNESSDRIDDVNFFRARTFDRMIDGTKARFAYKAYMERFPNGKNYQEAKDRLMEFGNF
ncbi:MAG: hypothetical protein JXR81_04755 [Candidatus Goldbacteria bacterium]|nr:hypothetical protein [Candidatus Goldiibacteriota bacterium]